MSLFENFPYTNLHELNLDWLINEIIKLEENVVLSVNGQTGQVILYKESDIILPTVTQDHWSVVRTSDGTTRGIMFGNDDIAYIVHGNTMSELYATNNQPPYPVTSVNGQTGDITLYSGQYVELPTLTDAQMHNWTLFRTINNVARGIQFDDDGSISIIDGVNRYQLYSENDTPPYPVTSVNGQTGDVSLFVDQNASVAFPAITNPNIESMSVGRNINNVPVYLSLRDNGTVSITAGTNTYQIYTEADITDDIIDVPTEAEGSTWGMIRTTAGGSVGILFDNNTLLSEPEAYIRYIDSNDQVQTVKLLTLADIPSSSGVVSVNGLSGVVVLTGEDIVKNTSLGAQTLDAYLTGLTATDSLIKESVAFNENTNTATHNIPEGASVIWNNHAYKASTAISVGDTLSLTNLTAIPDGGFVNNILTNMIPQKVIVDDQSKTTRNYHIPNGFRGIVFGASSLSAEHFAIMINCNANSGAIAKADIYIGANVTIGSSNNTLTITDSTASALELYVFAQKQSMIDAIYIMS